MGRVSSSWVNPEPPPGSGSSDAASPGFATEADAEERAENWVPLTTWPWVETHFGGFRCTTHFRTYFSGEIGMFTGGTIWILSRGHACRAC